jgi:non-ribosomal peptide synthetase component F
MAGCTCCTRSPNGAIRTGRRHASGIHQRALAQDAGLAIGDRVGDISYGVSQTPQVYLDHQVYQRGGHLYLSWDAVEELFPPGLLDDMFGAYCAFLRRLALDEAAWRETKPICCHLRRQRNALA